MNLFALRSRLLDNWSLWALLLIAVVWLYQSPYQASNLDVIPDSVEYSVGALQLLDTGRYEIIVQGRALPPRYPPWFSVTVLLPAYWLLGENPGNGIVPVTVLSVAGIGFAWAIGRRISSTAGAVLSALAVLAVPTYSTWATKVMTDVPCAALMLAACLLYLRLRSGAHSTASFLLAGVLVALATLFRPVFAAMVLPFLLAALLKREARFRSAIVLLFPLFVAAGATLFYNASTFGTPTRNGYHFWTAVPSDYPALTFSLAYAPPTLRGLLFTALPFFIVISIAAWLLVRARMKETYAAARRPLLDLTIFVVLTAVPISLFHVFYFFSNDRFHLALLSGMAVLAGSAVGLLVGERFAGIWKLVLPAVLLLAFLGRFTAPEPPPNRRIAADRVREFTPTDAIVISRLEPVFLDRLVARGSDRLIVPFSRRVEYAGKLLVRKRIYNPQPPPRSWRDQRAEGLIRGGAEEAVVFVASERLEELAAAAARGTPVFLESSALIGKLDAEIVKQVEERFVFIPRAPTLYELKPR